MQRLRAPTDPAAQHADAGQLAAPTPADVVQRLDRHRTRDADFRSISAAEIGALAKRYLDPKPASQFIMLPQRPVSGS